MRYYGALEAGGTKMVAAVFDETGAIVEREKFPTRIPAETMPELTMDLATMQEQTTPGQTMPERMTLEPTMAERRMLKTIRSCNRTVLYN